MSDEEADEIRLTLALILSNQGLIMTTLALLPGQKGTSAALNRASDIALARAKGIEKDLREKHGIKQSVS